MTKKIHIIDCTLREGNQAPGVKFDKANSIHIASLLGSCSIDMIEIGHPLASSDEFNRVKAVVDLKLNCPILSHARAHMNDIKAVHKTGAQWIGIFAGINDLSQTARLNRSHDQILELITNSVSFAKGLGLMVRYTVEDSSRTSLPLLLEAYNSAILAGADRICFADTLGVLEPKETFNYISKIRKIFPKTELEMHIHDDRGLAMANSLAAIDAGATWISTSVNGIGERCGITDTCALIANLVYKKFKDQQHLQKLVTLSKEVQSITNTFIDSRRPVIGEHAFTHTARLHRIAMEKDSKSYNWIDPMSLGYNKASGADYAK